MLALPIEGRMNDLQRRFAEAIFSLDAPIPATIRAASGNASTSRFGVYRNNVVASLVGAIGSRYPVCRKLLWPETFDGVARLYIMAEPPRTPVLLHYGESFPRFLRRIGEGVATEYVSDIAALETARVRAYHAADAIPERIEAFRCIPQDVLADLRMRLHPSVTLLRSRFPIVSIWESAIRDEDDGHVAWRSESALIARPQDDVLVFALPAGGFAFFTAVAEGRTIAEAATCAAEDANFDLEACFHIMMSSGVVVGLDRAC
jgi:hypothetical protein